MSNIDKLKQQNIICGDPDAILADFIDNLSDSELQVIIDLHKLGGNTTPWQVDQNGQIFLAVV